MRTSIGGLHDASVTPAADRSGASVPAPPCHAARMDLESWTPVDNARRLATLIAVGAAMFSLMALWLGAAWHPLLALLAAALTGVLVWAASFRLLRYLLRR